MNTTMEQGENSQIALLPRLADFVAEYDAKVSGVAGAVAAFGRAGDALKQAACIGGTWGDTSIDTGSAEERVVKASVLKSAWRHAYAYLQVDRIASAQDKRRFQQAMADPAPFTMDNIRATFGPFISDPRSNVLRGLAEVFSDLDPAYKSHEKVKIGVAGLPKRVILSGFGKYSYGSWGRDKLRDLLNAVGAFQGKPLIEYDEIAALLKDEDALLYEWQTAAGKHPARGVRLRRFANGNGHLFFEPDTLRDINLALAEFYGEVLADCSDDGEPRQRRGSTAVATDLQYYPTPQAVVERVLDDICIRKEHRVLEPSCGCGRFLDALRAKGARTLGVEVDPSRAEACRAKGHNVLTANFLETVPTGDFDRVIMNPPFYGRHYAKHVLHALKFLKPDGVLTAILPVTARYDHGLLEGSWRDLPVGSFSESGTNINTTVLTMWACDNSRRDGPNRDN